MAMRAAIVVLGLLAVACKPDVPPAAVGESAGDPADAGGDEEAVGEDGGDGVASDPVDDGRTLWFADGPGRRAILARERRDHETAVAELDALLADASLSPDDRGAAQWLRGLEDLRSDLYESAAKRFAEARKAPALAIVEARLRILEARALLSASQPADALAVVDGLDPAGTPHAGELLIVEGDARLRTDDFAGARKAYEGYLARKGENRRAEVRSKLAKTLLSIGGPAELEAAVEHYERLLLAVPLSDYGEEAKAALPELRKRAGVKARPGFSREVELARTEAMVDRRHYGSAVKAADKILKKVGPGAEKCQALYLKGSAIFKQRQRAKARPVFDKADKACKKAGKAHEGTRVKSRYQAGRGYYAEGKYSAAAKAFESLAKEHASHSYCDDAWILAGESWEEGGKPEEARKAYRKALAVNGDMLAEARRRLLVMAFAKDDFDDALKLTDSGLAGRLIDPKAIAKLHYFRGRALAGLGRAQDAAAAYVEAVRALPLGYASLQALSRLREASPEALETALAILEEAKDAAGTGVLPDTPAAKRALLLARLGLGEDAQQELSIAKVDGWPAAAVLNDAGLFAEAQRLVANLGSRWRRTPPVGPARERWETAHPKPFADLVFSGEREHAVPDLLTWAIMQTESRFNPGVTSWAGARGLVQLMPATAEGLAKSAGVELDDLDRLYDPALNLDLGQRYLGDLTARFGGGSGGAALAIPSYNGGAGNVDKWLGRRGKWTLDLFIEAIPFDETRKYTQSVLGRWMTYRWLYGNGEAADRIPFLPADTPKRT